MATISGSMNVFGRLVAVMLLILGIGIAGTTGARAEAAGTLSNQQIEQLVAPVALYPDDLLAQVLMASTYPLEVVEAARWVKENPSVTGPALEDAMQKQSWDPSVKALTAVPQTLAMMSDQLKWTQDLGDAFLAQQNEVFDAVQRLRARADAAGNLKTTPQQKVTRVNRPAGSPSSAPATAYTIVPANPQQIYVPVYDPGVVYGAWPYPAYAPPFYWYPPGYVATGVFGFAAGVAAGAAIWGGVNWWNRSANINVNRYNSFNRTNITSNNWNHNAAHRGGVPYNNPRVQQQFGGSRDKARDSARENLATKGGAGKGQGAKGQGGKGQAAKGGMAGGMAGGAGDGGGKAAAKGGAGKAGGSGKAGAKAGGGTKAGAKTGGGMTGGGGGMAGGATGGGMAGGGMAATGGGMAGGGMAGGGMAGGGMAGGGMAGMRSDITLKHDIVLLGRLDNGLGFYRFVYNGSDTAYVGVMAQEVRQIMPDAVVRGRDGYLRVYYDKLGLTFQTYDQWLAAGAAIPSPARRQ